MALFEALVVVHVVTGAVGLTAFWGPIVTRKGAANHRKWGKAACYGFLGAGAALAAHPGVHHLSFTGSVGTGALVQAAPRAPVCGWEHPRPWRTWTRPKKKRLPQPI